MGHDVQMMGKTIKTNMSGGKGFSRFISPFAREKFYFFEWAIHIGDPIFLKSGNVDSDRILLLVLK
jgi:hypothetical protein